MNRKQSVLICLIAAAVLGAGLIGFGTQRLQAQAAPKPEPKKAQKTAVAVVNVAQLIAKCQKNIEFQKKITKRQTSLQAEMNKKKEKIDIMRKDLDDIPNPQARAEKERKIIQAMAEYQGWIKIQQQFLLRDQRTALIELYGEIDKTVAAVAEREGYDLVLFDTPSPDFARLNTEQLVQAIGNRRVVYRSNKADLTNVVLEQMNLNYLNRGGN